MARTIDDMLKTPGIFVVFSWQTCFLAEVMADGTCHQLNPDSLERDGELRRDGWLDIDPRIVGPLARVAAPKPEDHPHG